MAPVGVWDVFLFNDELDLLEIRLEALRDVADHVVVIEAPLTFTGQPKPLHFAEHRGRFAHDGRVRHVAVDLDPTPRNPWAREHEQRRHARDFIERAVPAGDLVLFGDVDEIPEPAVVARLRDELSEPVRLSMTHANYYANLVQKPTWTMGTLAFRPGMEQHPEVDYYLGNDTREWQSERARRVDGAGWHLSFLGGPDAIRAKVAAYSHQEYNGDADRRPGEVERWLRYGVHMSGEHVLRRVPRSELPPFLQSLSTTHPEFFDFRRGPGRLRAHAYAGYLFLRRHPLRPRWLRRFADVPPGLATTVLMPVFLGVDTARRGVRKLRARRTQTRSS
ncbi:MAG TPA: hypothetical protein VFH66_12505 [Mycobacteriales bacterium]|nr:hypothetical protein [Mycobacteriales bacterium]